MTRTVAWIMIVGWFACNAGLAHFPPVPIAVAQEDWKADFEDICAKTQDAMALTREELRSLVDRCDRLRPRIEKLDESASKVYLRRLQMCRDLYVFALESKAP
jgi:hypothetical protein